MMGHFRDVGHRFVASFHDSEVILWARLQYIIFLVYTGLQAVDVSVFISDKRMLQGYILFNAMMTEVMRRHRADFDGEH